MKENQINEKCSQNIMNKVAVLISYSILLISLVNTKMYKNLSKVTNTCWFKTVSFIGKKGSNP